MTKLGQCLFLFILLLIPIAAKPARACTCVFPDAGKSVERQILEARKRSKALFAGRVREIITPAEPSSLSVIFQVQTGWKGIKSESITILTGQNGSCGYRFQLGEVYLVYAYQSSISHLGTSICQRTQPFKADIIDLKYLGRPKFETSKTSAVEGPKRVDFCELVSNPEKYFREIVRTTATYTENFEGTGLSKSCPSASDIRDTTWGRWATAEVEFECLQVGAIGCAQLEQKLKQDLRGDPIDGRSADVQVIGRVEII